MDAGVLRRLDYIVLGNGFIEKGDILPYRPRDLKYILIHGGKGIDDDGAGDFPPLHPVKEHFSRPFLIQSRDDFRQGGFAAAGGTHHGYPAPRLQVHIKMLQKGRLQRAVTEAHILHHQIPRQAGALEAHFALVGRVVQAVYLVAAHIVQPLHLHFRGLQRRAQSQELPEGSLKAAHKILEGHEDTGGHHPLHDGEAADGHDEGAIDPRQKPRQELHLPGPVCHFLGGHNDLGTVTRPLGEEIPFAARGLDALDHHQAVHGGAEFLAPVVLRPHG